MNQRVSENLTYKSKKLKTGFGKLVTAVIYKIYIGVPPPFNDFISVNIYEYLYSFTAKSQLKLLVKNWK